MTTSREIDAIIVRGASVTAEMMDRAKKLKVIAKHGIGCNSIDVEAAKQRGIQVIYTPPPTPIPWLS